MKILHIANRHHDEPSVGHGYWLNKAFKDSCEENGIEFVIVSSLQGKGDITLPLLTLNQAQRSRFTFFPLIGIWHDFKVLTNLLQDHPHSNSVLHIYEGGLRELLLLLLVRTSHPALRAIFNFNLSDPWDTALVSKSRLSQLAWQVLSKNVTRAQPAVLFTAETEELAELFEDKLGFRPKEYPFPALTSRSVNKGIRKEFDFFIAVLGDPELKLVMAALTQYRLIHNQKPKVMIQSRWSEPVSSELASEAIQSHGVVFLESIASKSSYESAIRKSKVVVLPYSNTDYYKLQSSSRMIDAVALGARVIAPEHTAIGRQLEANGWGYTFIPTSVASLSDALAKSLQAVAAAPVKLLPRSAHESIIELVALLDSQSSASAGPDQSPAVSKRDIVFMSLLFLVSDLRSFFGGMLRLFGAKVSLQKRLNNWLPRRNSSLS
jgi:hypothetical protein